MTHGKALSVLRQLAEKGYCVSIVYGRCPCEVHANQIGWPLQVYALKGVEPVLIMENQEAARSFEHCAEIAQAEVAQYERGLH